MLIHKHYCLYGNKERLASQIEQETLSAEAVNVAQHTDIRGFPSEMHQWTWLILSTLNPYLGNCIDAPTFMYKFGMLTLLLTLYHITFFFLMHVVRVLQKTTQSVLFFLVNVCGFEHHMQRDS